MGAAPRFERFEPRRPVPLNVHMQKSLSVGPRRLGEVLPMRQNKKGYDCKLPGFVFVGMAKS